MYDEPIKLSLVKAALPPSPSSSFSPPTNCEEDWFAELWLLLTWRIGGCIRSKLLRSLTCTKDCGLVRVFCVS